MKAKRRSARPKLPEIEANAEQVAAAKLRLNHTADRTEGFREAFPYFQETVDALPKIEPLCRVVHELRAIFLDALVQQGVDVPDEIWSALNMGFYREKPIPRSAVLYAVAEPTAGGPQDPFAGTKYRDAYRLHRQAQLFAEKHPVARVRIREAAGGEASTYWAWWDRQLGTFMFLSSSKEELLRTYFYDVPGGADTPTAHGEGRIANVVVEKVDE